MINPVKLISTSVQVLLLSTALVYGKAQAESPPDLPLPPCEMVDGQQQGACPQTNDHVSGQASGTLSENVAIPVQIVPMLPVCDKHIGYPPYPWTPGPCYSAVHKPVVLTCGYIDLLDGGVWREDSCSRALFRNPSDANYPMFTVTPAEGSSGCGGIGNYGTYVYGGPANVAGATWAEFGPNRRKCNLTFNGPRPDGLYGPTWVKLRVGIDKAEDGDERRGYAEYAEFFVPIDGDMREQSVDVSVLATSRLVKAGDQLFVTYTVTLTNEGEKDAEDVKLIAVYPPSTKLGDELAADELPGFPPQLHIIRVYDDRCVPNPPQAFVGGSFSCSGIALKGTNDPLGGDVEFIKIFARITNASDFQQPITFRAVVPDDIDDSNNEDNTAVSLNLSGGSIAQTRQAMEVLAPYFNYETDLRDTACNSFRRDIYSRFEQIRLAHPEVFANLSYGPVTSGAYSTGVSAAGHVGLVVYPRGTNYHETGIVIHGTPSISPLGLRAGTYDTQVGAFPMGEQPVKTRIRGTTAHGFFYRTPVDKFPGYARPEGPGCGFEGIYADNADDFARPGPAACATPDPTPCPFEPNAVVATVESPVEVHVTNPRGQRVQTLDGKIVTEELDGGIHSMPFPHTDGTFGWTLVLPVDDYDVKLVGTAEGSYKMTVTTYDKRGTPIASVVEGTTVQGKNDTFAIDSSAAALLDIDHDGLSDALTDGLLLTRRLSGFSGMTLIEGVVSPDARRSEAADIGDYIDGLGDTLDVDLNGRVEASTDGLLITRRLFGFAGETLIDGAVAPDAQITDPVEISNRIDALKYPNVIGE